MVYHTSNIHLLFISIIYLKNFSRANNNNLSKFVKIRVHNHRVQSYILAHPSKRSFEDFTVTLRSRKKKKKPAPSKKRKFSKSNSILSIEHSRETSFPEWLEHPSPPSPSIIRPVRHITRARIKRWGFEALDRRRATAWKNGYTGGKGGKNEENEEGKEESAGQIQLIEYRSNLLLLQFRFFSLVHYGNSWPAYLDKPCDSSTLWNGRIFRSQPSFIAGPVSGAGGEGLIKFRARCCREKELERGGKRW